MKQRSARARALTMALLALLALAVSAGLVASCTAVLGIDTSYGDNPCITGLDDAGVKLKPLTCGKGICLKILPACDDNGLPNTCPDGPDPNAKEKCSNGLDDECNGLADDGCECKNGQTQACYRGSTETRSIGLCRDGTQTCKNGTWSECVGDVLPTPEVCDQRDNDCNGKIDDGPDCTCSAGQKQPCYNGPDGTLGHANAPCKEGTQSCDDTGHWGDCDGAVAPRLEECEGTDENCNGMVDEGLEGCCKSPLPCYTGPKMPLDTEGVGACHAGTQICIDGKLSACMGEVVPSPEQCNNVDDDCNGKVDDGDFGIGMPCTIPGLQGPCALGEKACGTVGPFCKQITFPSTETCNGVDDDCDGSVDNGNPGGGGFCQITDPGIKGECVNGVNKCEGGHIVCAQNYLPQSESCNGKDDDCNGKIDDGPLCCPDGIKDGNESDTDCGGACAQASPPLACAAGLSCVQDIDCQSFICKSNKCQTATCNDMVKNGTETDIDCGGNCPAKCDIGRSCKSPNDCTSGVCITNVCITPQCSDGVKNGNETDVDCGGPTCPKCGPAQICVLGTDCQSLICINGHCTGATCSDTILNGTETDVDCGGNCPSCNNGKKCKVGSDCTSAVCSGGVCQASSCGDGVKNGNETDVDCGGPCPLKCGTGKVCNTGTDCSSGVCNNNFCAQKPNAATCNTNDECQSGYCRDGVCCNTPCGGVCMACSAAKKGSGNDGVCAPVGAGADPDAECLDQGQTSCGTDGFCDGAGNCRLYSPGTTCQSASCAADGITLNKAGTCNGLGSCISGGVTNCTPNICASGSCAITCQNDTFCAANAYCKAMTCVGKKADGALCGASNECLSGNCVDGVCCNLPCAGPCQACTAAKKGSGNDGLCGNVTAGTDPDNECAFQSQSTCGTTGFCDGFGQCQRYAGGVSCAPKACSNPNTLNNGSQCDGNGNCVSNGTQSCGNYLCSGTACLTTCVTSADCSSAAYCSGSVCVPKKSNGASCAATSECVSSACVDGVCCDTACTGPCQACTAALRNQGVDGTCGPILTGTDPQNECTDQGSNSCGTNGVCDGVGACQKYPAGTSCGVASCSGTVLTNANTCNGAGSCVNNGTTNCAPYACGGTACNTFCTADTDCAPSAYCSGSQCKLKNPNGVACLAPNECGSGNCVDGFCCTTPCTGPCQACSAAKKGSGADGACGPVKVGSDPDDECADQGTNSCGTNGSCDGAGACQKYAAGTVCGAGVCNVDGVHLNFPGCNGSGTCNSSGTTVSCAPYVCAAGACKTTCGGDGDCTTGNYCLMTTCVPKKAVGVACSGGNECGSGNCVDGVCCGSASCPACQVCNVTGSLGTCASTTLKLDTTPSNTCFATCASATSANTGTCNNGACSMGMSNCTGNQSCAAGACLLANSQNCTSDSACASNYCAGMSQKCSACMPGLDCGSGTCWNSTMCVRPSSPSTPCSVNAQCSSNFCKASVCTVCSTPADCGGSACVGGVCKMSAGVPCAGDAHCAGGTCNTTTSVCN